MTLRRNATSPTGPGNCGRRRHIIPPEISSKTGELFRRYRTGRISYQVLQGYYVTVTRKLDPGLRITEARDDVRDFLAWNPLSTERNVVEGAWSIQDRFKFSWWDALIVAAAQVLDCDYLLSEDIQHKQAVDGLTILNPFLEEPQ